MIIVRYILVMIYQYIFQILQWNDNTCSHTNQLYFNVICLPKNLNDTIANVNDLKTELNQSQFEKLITSDKNYLHKH